MSRYGYLEEYKELIELEKIALKKACDIMNDSSSSNAEVMSAISKINEVVNTIKSIYQFIIYYNHHNDEEDDDGLTEHRTNTDTQKNLALIYLSTMMI
jgi:hypothetical protein